MPTSSVFTNVALRDAQSVNILIDAFEEAEKNGPIEMTDDYPVMNTKDIKPTFEKKKIGP